MKLLLHILNVLFAQPDLTPHSRNAAMRRLLAISEERKHHAVVIELERRNPAA